MWRGQWRFERRVSCLWQSAAAASRTGRVAKGGRLAFGVTLQQYFGAPRSKWKRKRGYRSSFSSSLPVAQSPAQRQLPQLSRRNGRHPTFLETNRENNVKSRKWGTFLTSDYACWSMNEITSLKYPCEWVESATAVPNKKNELRINSLSHRCVRGHTLRAHRSSPVAAGSGRAAFRPRRAALGSATACAAPSPSRPGAAAAPRSSPLRTRASPPPPAERRAVRRRLPPSGSTVQRGASDSQNTPRHISRT